VIPGAAPAAQPSSEALSTLFELFASGRHAELEPLLDDRLRTHPNSPPLLHLAAATYLMRGRAARAVQALQLALRISPGSATLLGLLGVALGRCEQHEQARAAFEASLAREADNYETLVNYAAGEVAAGDAARAETLAARALRVRPDGIEALFTLGNAQVGAGRVKEAVDTYRRAIALAPRRVDLYLNLGVALIRCGCHDDAVAALARAVALRPDYAAVHLNLGRALHELGESARARHHFRVASDLDQAMAEASSAYLFSLTHDATVAPERVFAEHLRIGELIEAPLRGRWPRHDNNRDLARPLRVGFVSADLREHPVANLIEPIWRAMRLLPHRILAYANGAWNDPVQARLRMLVDEWVQVDRLDDAALFERIRGDRIDILFDLSGHSAGHRLPVFARKPAPVQVTWIGYPGTTGLSAIDYRLVRVVGVQASQMQALFRERLVQLQVRGFEPPADSPPVGPLPAASRDYVTFASFNRPSKLAAPVIALWSRVLAAVPGSRMVVGAVSEEPLRRRLTEEFASHGVDAGRLSFRPRVGLREFLALHHEVDVALDSFPYSGGTTTMFALWMGVPVVTLVGPTMAQRQSASSIRWLGLDDWVAEDEEQFVRRAVAAAADLPALTALRSGLRGRLLQRHAESDEQTAREMDAALRGMWQRWCDGRGPEGFAVPPAG
jgi:predicted O-linked N-acetylglucosamine transferase (SPINDLY family)